MVSSSMEQLRGYHPLISCEGTAEQVLIEVLSKSDALVFLSSDIVDITRIRKARDIQDEYLNYDYDWPVCIVRVHDSRKERFNLNGLYASRFPVVDIITHPEIEFLTIIHEGVWGRWSKSGKKSSVYCLQDLGMKGIKSREFLESYWDCDSIVSAAKEYRRVSKLLKGELCLDDLICFAS